MMYLNINSLTANKTELEWIVNQWKPTVICLVETHITKDLEDSEINMIGYKAVHALSTSRHTGGASIYVKEELHYGSTVNIVINGNLWLVGINLCVNGKKYNVINIYHSPNASDIVFLDKLEEIIGEYAVKTDMFVLTGDFNINIAKDSYYSKKLKDIIKSNGMYQIVQNFTRITDNTATMIDLIITNEKSIEYQIHHTPKIADHSIMTIEFPSFTRVKQKISVRNMKNFNELQFQLDIMSCVWPITLKSTNEMANHLVQIITDKLNKHAPIVEREAMCKWGNKKWWTLEIKYAISNRDRLYRRAMITGLEDDWITYKQNRNKVVQLIKEKKQAYYNSKIDEAKGDSREMWRTLKDLVISGKNSNRQEGIFFKGKIERDNKIIAEKFNEYFLQSISAMTNDIGEIETQEVLNNIETPISKFDSFEPLQMIDLRKTVKNLKNKTSSVDGINVKILKLAFDVIGDWFLKLINTSLERGSFPQEWKKTTIIPIEKVTNTNRCEEYRPINMVATYEKLLETIVSKQMRKYVEENRLLTHCQAGFRKNHSCESALQTVISKWKSSIGEKKLVGVVLLDFQRAFETINRKLLVRKLKKYGFGGNVLKWFYEYLDNRTQQTKYNGTLSSIKINRNGVPQGTVLGPDLFVLYINDIVKVVKKCELQLFADDTILYYESDNITDLVQTINEDLHRVHKWLCRNSLRVNVKKTKFMILKSKHNSMDNATNDGIVIDNDRIEQVKECKYLGVIIDENLSFSSHATYITKKVSRKIYFLCRIGKNLSTWTKLLIYKSIIMPHLNYCSTILFMFNKRDIDNLQKKQNWALRCITGGNRYSRIKDMLKTTDLLSVKQIIFLNTMIVVFKIKNRMYPEHILEKLQFVNDIHTYNTRNRLDFYVPTVNSSYAENCLFHRGLIEFNNLPMNLKNINFVNFKKLLRSYIIDNHSI